MKCLCCGKEIKEKDMRGWHPACVRNFFGTEEYPIIDLSSETLEKTIIKNVSKKITVAGVQKKLSLHMSSLQENRLTMVNYPTGYILKPQTEAFLNLPEYEFLTMKMAEVCGIKTVPCGLVRIGDELAYITKRIDRSFDGSESLKYAMEDFCQLSERLTEDKYKGSYEKCAKIIDEYSSRPMFDKTELFLRLVFCFVTGNSDMHLKNFSLIEEKIGSGDYTLSAAYDLLPVNVVMSEDNEETALTLNGKKNRISKKDFMCLADKIGINSKSADKIIEMVNNRFEKMKSVCDSSILEKKQIDLLFELMDDRMQRLS